MRRAAKRTDALKSQLQGVASRFSEALDNALPRVGTVMFRPEQTLRGLATRYGDDAADLVRRALVAAGRVNPEDIPAAGRSLNRRRVPLVRADPGGLFRRLTTRALGSVVTESPQTRIPERVARRVRDMTIDEANRFAAGDDSVLFDLVKRASEQSPEVIEDVARQALAIREEVAREVSAVTGTKARFLVADGGLLKDQIRAAGVDPKFFETDPLTIFARDAWRLRKTVFASNLFESGLKKLSYAVVPRSARNFEQLMNENIARFGGSSNVVPVAAPKRLLQGAEDRGAIIERVLSGGVQDFSSVGPDDVVYFMPRVSFEMLQNTSRELLAGEPGPVSRFLQSTTGLMARMVTSGFIVPNVAFNTRNFVQDQHFLAMAGITPFSVEHFQAYKVAMAARVFARAGEMPAGTGDHVVTRSGHTLEQVVAMVTDSGMWEQGRIREGLQTFSVPELGRAGRRVDLRQILGELAFGLPRRVTDWANAVPRIQGLLWHLNRGFTAEDAVGATKAALYDPASLSRAERTFARPLMPFWAWTRFNVPRQFRFLAEAPATVSSQFRAVDVSRQEFLEDNPDLKAAVTAGGWPKWFVAGFPFILSHDEDTINTLLLRFALPAADLESILSVEPFNASGEEFERLLQDAAVQIGGPLPTALGIAANLNIGFSAYTGSFQELERTPGERIDVRFTPGRFEIPGAEVRVPARPTPSSFVESPARTIFRAGQLLFGLPFRDVRSDEIRDVKSRLMDLTGLTIREREIESLLRSTRRDLQKELGEEMRNLRKAIERGDEDNAARSEARILLLRGAIAGRGGESRRERVESEGGRVEDQPSGQGARTLPLAP